MIRFVIAKLHAMISMSSASHQLWCRSELITRSSRRHANLELLKVHILISQLYIILIEGTATIRCQIIIFYVILWITLIRVRRLISRRILLIRSWILHLRSESVRSMVAGNHSLTRRHSIHIVLLLLMVLVVGLKVRVINITFWECWLVATWYCWMSFKIFVIISIMLVYLMRILSCNFIKWTCSILKALSGFHTLMVTFPLRIIKVSLIIVLLLI